MSTPFLVPFVAPNPDSWGPRGFYEDENNPDSSPRSGKFLDLPYSPFGRSDRLGRAADFTNLNRGDRSRFNRQGRYEKSERNNDKDEGGTSFLQKEEKKKVKGQCFKCGAKDYKTCPCDNLKKYKNKEKEKNEEAHTHHAEA